jgi:hypothetical protein
MPANGLPTELMRSNVPPTAAQSHQVHRLISERQQKLLNLEKQHSDPAVAHIDVAARQKQVHSEIVALQAIVSPVRRIPPEILAEFFLHCVEHVR